MSGSLGNMTGKFKQNRGGEKSVYTDKKAFYTANEKAMDEEARTQGRNGELRGAIWKVELEQRTRGLLILLCEGFSHC